MARETIKLPRSSYEELRKIIVAYGKLDTPSGLDEIASLTGIGRTRISDNSAFLTTIGLIEGGKRKSPTPNGITLAQALEHDIPEKVAEKWTVVVEENEFLNKMLQAINIRKGMEVSQFETHIAYSAGEAKSDRVMTGARTVIDILRASGLVVEEDGQIKPNPASTSISQGTSADSGRTQVSDKSDQSAQFITQQHQAEHQVTLHIELRINATPSELDGLGEKVKALIASLVDTDPDDSSPSESSR